MNNRSKNNMDPDDWDDSNIILVPIFGKISIRVGVLLPIGIVILSYLLLVKIAIVLGLELRSAMVLCGVVTVFLYTAKFVISVLSELFIKATYKMQRGH